MGCMDPACDDVVIRFSHDAAALATPPHAKPDLELELHSELRNPSATSAGCAPKTSTPEVSAPLGLTSPFQTLTNTLA